MSFSIYNSHDIDKIIVMLKMCKDTADVNKEYEMYDFFDVVIEIVNQWKYDNSQWDFKQDHYRQAVSFLMRFAEETGKIEDDYPEYFEDRFFDILKCYKALEYRFNERLRGDN